MALHCRYSEVYKLPLMYLRIYGHVSAELWTCICCLSVNWLLNDRISLEFLLSKQTFSYKQTFVTSAGWSCLPPHGIWPSPTTAKQLSGDQQFVVCSSRDVTPSPDPEFVVCSPRDVSPFLPAKMWFLSYSFRDVISLLPQLTLAVSGQGPITTLFLKVIIETVFYLFLKDRVLQIKHPCHQPGLLLFLLLLGTPGFWWWSWTFLILLVLLPSSTTHLPCPCAWPTFASGTDFLSFCPLISCFPYGHLPQASSSRWGLISRLQPLVVNRRQSDPSPS